MNSMLMKLRVAATLLVLTSMASSAQGAPSVSLSLGDRISCQAAIERVYWRHRTSASDDATSKPSFEESVPANIIQARAEDVVLKSTALERFWGVTITGAQLQAELDRMAANSKSPDVLAELFAAVGNDPQAAAECLARPLLVDRLTQGYFASDQRFHGDLKARVQAELASATPATMKNMSGQYREMEWQRGRHGLRPGVMALESGEFDRQVRGLHSTLDDRSGDLALGRISSLREDANRFYAVAVIAQDTDHVRLASIEWPKVSFDAWWPTTRQQLPMQLAAIAYGYALPRLAPNANCRDDSWKPTMQLLDPRYFHTAVWTGTEMIVWGGSNAVGTYYNDGSRYNPATDTYTLVASLGAPSAREAHAAVWTGKEMVIFGGTGDTTGGRYNPVTDTWKPTSQVGAPLGQQYSAAVWTGKEMIVWGGILFSPVNTGARYNPTTDKWTTLPPVSLAPRAYMPAVWTGSEMVVWAGYDITRGQVYNDGARYNPTTNSWKLTNLTGAASARYWHTAVWTGSEMIVWGGVQIVFDQSGGRYNPATDTWTPTSLVNPPSLRWLHSAVWTGREMIIQGGTGGPPDHSIGGRYNPATDTWRPTNPTNGANNGQGITAVWTGKEMIVWGGLDDNFVFHNDGGRYNPRTDSWLRTSTMNVPAARSFHSAVWTGSEMIIWGGIGDVILSDGGRYDPATDNWKMISNVSAPLGGGDGQGVWSGSEAIFWVGSNPGGRYNPVTDSWKLMSIVNAPSETLGHSAVWTGTEMIVYGGISSSLNAKRYKPATDTWTDATLVNDPGHRDHHGAVWTGKEMIVWGGSIDSGYVGPEGGRYNPTTDTWTVMSPSGLDALRIWPVSVWTGREAIFWGGYNQLFTVYYNDGGRYNPVTNSWMQTSLANAPSPRIAQGVWTGKEMLLWGGVDDSSGGRYNPATDSWKDTTLVNSPIVRGGGRWSTVWTGNQMIVWGGYVETQQGSLYCASGTPNSAPVASNDSYTTLAGKQLVVGPNSGVLLNDTDANADFLTAQALSKPGHGILQLNANGSFLYRPTAGYVGPDSFTYQASDGLAVSNIATVNITVQ
jgi:N-acetylneuraminic acid mutarotase